MPPRTRPMDQAHAEARRSGYPYPLQTLYDRCEIMSLTKIPRITTLSAPIVHTIATRNGRIFVSFR